MTAYERVKEWRIKNPNKRREQNQRWYQRNKEHALDVRREWRKRNPHYWRKRGTGIEAEQWKELFDAQNGLCAICKTAGGPRGLVTDHDHETGRIRQLLCNNCNRCLGLLGDSIEVLESALNYLRKHKE